MEKNMAKDNNCGLMAQNMTVCGKMIKQMDRDV
jgi:hypothetical protein